MKKIISKARTDSTSIFEDHFDQENDPLFGFYIKEGIDESAIGAVANIVHRHQFYEIIFIDEADGEHIVDYSTYDDLKNVVFLIRQGQTHYWRNVTRAKGVLICFNEAFLFESCISRSSMWEAQLFKEISESPAIYMSYELSESMRNIVKQMLKEYQEKKQDYAQILRSYLNIMLIQFYRYHRMAEDHENGVSFRLSANQLSYRFQKLLDQKVAENLSVTEYAQILGVSQGNLNKQLKEQIGYPAGTLIRNAQIMEIKRLLVSTELSISEIAETMNFSDTAYLCRAFKRETGVSPSNYRLEARGRQKRY